MKWLIRGLSACAALALCLFVIVSLTDTDERPIPETVPGYRSAALEVAHRSVPVQAHLFYPAERGTPELFGQNALFYGLHVAKGAAPLAGPHPVVVFSHGSGGMAQRHGWLIEELVSRGYVVAAVDHPGTMSADSDPFQTIKIWERPQDMTALLDALPMLAEGVELDPERIGVIGFSLGGHSALSLSGLRVRKQGFIEYCARYPDKIDCGWMTSAGVDFTAIDAVRYEQSNKDPRVRATVAVDPALVLATAPESYPDLDHPVLLINLGAPEGIPSGLRADTLAAALPNADFEFVPEAWHFSFMTECSPFGRAMIALAGEDNICTETGARSRADIHAELRGKIGDWLEAHL